MKTENTGQSETADDAGSDSASADEPSSGPAYQGKAVPDIESDASGSIASPDGNCPIADTLGDYGINCPSCTESHCVDALAQCNPTMVNACAEYYCPTQCPQLDAQLDASSGSGSACGKVMQCCPTLIGTPLGLQCIGIQAGSAQATCQMLLSQAQAIGRCQ